MAVPQNVFSDVWPRISCWCISCGTGYMEKASVQYACTYALQQKWSLSLSGKKYSVLKQKWYNIEPNDWDETETIIHASINKRSQRRNIKIIVDICLMMWMVHQTQHGCKQCQPQLYNIFTLTKFLESKSHFILD